MEELKRMVLKVCVSSFPFLFFPAFFLFFLFVYFHFISAPPSLLPFPTTTLKWSVLHPRTLWYTEANPHYLGRANCAYFFPAL